MYLLPIWKFTSVFHNLPIVGPKQLRLLEHLGCARKVGPSFILKYVQNQLKKYIVTKNLFL